MIQILVAILLLIAYFIYPAVAGPAALIIACCLAIGYLMHFMERDALNYFLGIFILGIIAIASEIDILTNFGYAFIVCGLLGAIGIFIAETIINQRENNHY